MTDAALRIADTPKVKKLTNDKALRFRSIGGKRVNRLLKDIALIGNLSNRSAYAYSEGDRDKMFKRIKEAVDTCEAKFTPSYRDQDGFSF
jgi:hypothetical protein